MSILLAIVGATVGAVIGSLFMHWRNDVAKERQQLESQTPYDYALTGARSDNKRLRDELVTLRALKRTEADTERIRNEIDTILSDDGEEPSEGTYDVDKAFMESTDLTFKRYYDVIKTADGRLTEEDEERSLINDVKDKASENLELAVEFAKLTVQDDEAIRKQLEETSKELAEEIRDVRRRMREFRKDGKYYGETLYRKGNR